MANRSYTILKAKNGLYRRIEFGETSVINTDILTLSGFHATITLTEVYVMSKVDGSTITATHTSANNVVTITAGATTETPCYYMAYGVKA